MNLALPTSIDLETYKSASQRSYRLRRFRYISPPSAGGAT
jgi:hypothetical protein